MIVAKCDACGSRHIKVKVDYFEVSEPFTAKRRVEYQAYECAACGTDGYLDSDTDTKISEAIAAAKAESVQNMIVALAERGENLSEVERILGLPQRTLHKWKASGKHSAPGLTLLKMVSSVPWLLEVAERRYNPADTAMIQIVDTTRKLAQMASSFMEQRNRVSGWPLNNTVSGGSVSYGIAQVPNARIAMATTAMVVSR